MIMLVIGFNSTYAATATKIAGYWLHILLAKVLCCFVEYHSSI